MRNPGNSSWLQVPVRAQHTFPHPVSSRKVSLLWPKLLRQGPQTTHISLLTTRGCAGFAEAVRAPAFPGPHSLVRGHD